MNLKTVLVNLGYQLSTQNAVLRVTFVDLLLDHATPRDGTVLQQLVRLREPWDLERLLLMQVAVVRLGTLVGAVQLPFGSGLR